MTTRSPARLEFLFNLFVTAIEDGGYGVSTWGRVFGYRCKSATDFGCIVVEDDAWDEAVEKVKAARPADATGKLPFADIKAVLVEGGQWHTVNADTMARGLRVLDEKKGLHESTLKPLMLCSRTNGEDGDYDVIGADAVLQAALLGEVVYG